MLIILRKIAAILVMSLIFVFSCYAVDSPYVSASSCVLIDGDTLEILYEKNSAEVRSMASTTKIMTTLLAVESGKLDNVVTVNDDVYIEGTAIGLKKGDKITLETLCYGMLLESGNDAAVVTASFLAGSEEKFSVLMNKKADEIGMENTNFVTASGLDDENHYTTAYDMALLGVYAIKNETFREISSSKSYKADYIEPDLTRTFSNHNKLLNYCDGVYGIKTGFTKKSGRCLVSACERNGKTLVAVTLNAPDDWNDHKKLYDYGYSFYEFRTLETEIPKTVNVIGSENGFIDIGFHSEKLIFYVKKNSELHVKFYINSNIYAPVLKNDYIGRMEISDDGYVIDEIPIIAKDNAELIKNASDYKPGFWQSLVDYICQLFT